jgi:hypothetical protein
MGWDRSISARLRSSGDMKEAFAMTDKHEHEHLLDFFGILSSGMAGALASAGIEREGDLDHMYDTHEPVFRREFEASAAAESHVWEEASRAHRYGWESHDRPELQGKSWEQVRSDLKAGWTGGRWFDCESFVRSAWERRASHLGHDILPAFERSQRLKSSENSRELTSAYRYGQTLAKDPRHVSDDWEAAEPEAHMYWEAVNEGTWEKYKSAIRQAWDGTRGKA